MRNNKLKNIFLSASIPSQERDAEYFNSADVSAIRDSVNALAKFIIPRARLIWGGHPSITPLIKLTLEQLNFSVQDHITLYQSSFFKDFFPKDNDSFAHIIVTDKKDNKDTSLSHMRNEMLSNNFIAGIFIGGMEGVLDEILIFKKYNPNAIILPIASTGGASLKIYNEDKENYHSKYGNNLINNYAYLSLFTKILGEQLNG